MPARTIRPKHKPIKEYRETLDRLHAQGATNEGELRRAFGALLADTARARG